MKNTDTERLDWLEKQTNGHPWVARQSVMGRGFRLHNTSPIDYPGFAANSRTTAREAIDAAIEKNKPSES